MWMYGYEVGIKKFLKAFLILSVVAFGASCSSDETATQKATQNMEVSTNSTPTKSDENTDTSDETTSDIKESEEEQSQDKDEPEVKDGEIDNTESTDPSAVPVVEISYPVEVTIEQTFCNAGDGDCWDYRTSAPSFYACEDSNDAAFRAANCTEENITVLVNKECGRVENSARPQSYQYYVIFNPSDTKFILNVTDTTGNYWGAHSNADLNPGSWVGHNFQWNLYNGVTYDIRGELTLEDGTVAAEFPLYSQTKNC